MTTIATPLVPHSSAAPSSSPSPSPFTSTPSIAPLAGLPNSSSPLPILILIAGAPCSGKKSVLNALRSKLTSLSNNTLTIATLHQLDFYIPHKSSSSENLNIAHPHYDYSSVSKPSPAAPPPPPPPSSAIARPSTPSSSGIQDSESPSAFDLPLLLSTINQINSLGAGGLGDGIHSAKSPKWDFASGRRTWGAVDIISSKGAGKQTNGIIPDVIIAEGHYLLTYPPLLSLSHIKIFTETDPDVRLARRVIRDSAPPYSLSLEHIFDVHVRYGKPAAEMSIQPTKVLADIILPKGAEGPGVELIAHGVVDDLNHVSGGSGRGGAKGKDLVLYPSSSSTFKEADLAGARSAVAYYETV